MALAKLSRVLEKDALIELLTSERIRENCWIADENQRKQRYRELITSGDRVALLQMISTLHQHKKEQAAAGRKLHLCDDNFLKDAEKLLNFEFSLVLGIQLSEVGNYIQSVLEQ